MVRSIRRQLILYFVVFALSLSAFSAAVTLFVFHRVEDRNIDQRLEQMLSAHPSERRLTSVNYVGSPEGAPAPFAERLEGLPPGLYEWEDEEHEAHALLVSDPNTVTKTVAIASFPESEVSETRFKIALLFGVILTSLLALWLARYLALRVVSPIEHLTAQLAGGPLDGIVRDGFTAERRDDEIGTLARALGRAGRDLAASAERERLFLREASHELRTPITVIQGVSDLLYESMDSGDTVTRERLQRLRRGLRRMNTSVLSLLAMARAEHRVMVSEIPPFQQQLEDLVEEAASLAPPGVAVDFQLKEAPASASAASMLMVVLSNLTRNAVQHTTEGRVHLEIEEDRAKVLDTGPGLPPKLLEQLRSTGPQPDLGIGLATVQRVCKRFDWGLHVECPRGGGTCITIELRPSSAQSSSNPGEAPAQDSSKP